MAALAQLLVVLVAFFSVSGPAEGGGGILPEGLPRHEVVHSEEHHVPRINEKEDILFYVYRRTSATQVYVDDPGYLHISHYDPTQHTYIITHGYFSSDITSTIQDIKNMYLQVEDCNVVGVDWSSLSDDLLYTNAMDNTVPVGKYVAKFVDFIVNQTGVDTKKLHLVGHSLGAHVMGIAGKSVTSGKIGRITGLDPAGPLYSLDETDNRLAVGDALFVDVIHSCAGIYGFDGILGDADFFPNGGGPIQPGCDIILGGICSHSRSWKYFVESIASSKFVSVLCDSYDDFLGGKCKGNSEVPMGNPTPSSARGTYYLQTAGSPPFALG